MTAEAVGFYCRMDIIEHDGPKGQVQLDGLPGALFFSQVRDTVAYLHMPEQSHDIAVAYVQDMSGPATWETPGPWIEATSALYVLGSDARGGMDAPEFVPFSDRTAAEAFAARHGGQIRPFAEITSADVLAPTEPQESSDTPDDIADRLQKLSDGPQG
ncbi:nitrous oxide reductase accessory protein NosL [Pseudooceanicola sp.]